MKNIKRNENGMRSFWIIYTHQIIKDRKREFLFKVLFGLILVVEILEGGNTMREKDFVIKRERVHAHTSLSLSTFPLRGLFIGLGEAQHDVVDLAKFLPLEPTIIPVNNVFNPQGLGTFVFYWRHLERTPNIVIAELHRELEKPYHLIVLHPLPKWRIYPEDIRKKIVNKVQDGCVLIAYGADEELKRLAKKEGTELPYEEEVFPSYQLDDFHPLVYRLGHGKIAFLETKIDSRFGYLVSVSPNKAIYEYRLSRLARFILRLQKENMQPIISTLKIISNPFPQIATVTCNSNPKFFLLTAILYNSEGEIEKKMGVPPSGKIFFPNLPNGTYFFEIIALQNNIVIDRAGTWFEVNRPQVIRKISLRKYEFNYDDQIQLEIEYRGEFTSPKIRITLMDSWQRIYFKKILKGSPSYIEFRVPDGSLSILNYLKLELFDRNELIDVKKVEFTIPKNYKKQDFYVFMWYSGGSGDWRKKIYFDAVRRAGVDGLTNTGFTKELLRDICASNLLIIPYTTAFHGITLPELFSKEWVAKTEEKAREAALNNRIYGGFGHTLGDENYMNAFKPEGRFWDGEEVWEEFQEYLRKVYSSIDALNKQWDTTYIDWKDIRFTTEEEMLRNKQNPSPWVDFRMFITKKFIDTQRKIKDVIKEINPDAFVGWDGCEQFSSYDGYDWFQYTQGFDLNNIYINYFISNSKYPNKIFNGYCVRSFTPKTNLRGCWMNNVDPIWGVHYAPWFLLFSGFNSIWWWSGTFPGLEIFAFDWFYKPTPVFEELIRETQEIKKGPASLLFHSEEIKSPIAIHYSENNWHASTLSSGIGNHVNNLGLSTELWFSKKMTLNYLDPGADFVKLWSDIEPAGHYAVSSKNFITMMNDMGFGCEMVARQQIETGYLNNYKVLILPFVESLSLKEAQAIKDFVQNGGFLIADYRCGIRDEHGKMYPKGGILDEVFGIQQASGGPIKKQPMKVYIDKLLHFSTGIDLISGSFPIVFSQQETKSLTALPLGCTDEGTQIFFFNKYGRGYALFLNCDIYNYYELRRNSLETNMREIFGILLRGALGDCFDRPRYKNGRFLDQTFIFNYKDGLIVYTGVIRDFVGKDSSTWEVVIPLKKEGYIYDVRTKKYLGFGNKVETLLGPGEAKLFACLPYRIREVKVKSKSGKLIQRGDKVICDIYVIPEGGCPLQNHTVYITVLDSTGNDRFYLAKTLYLTSGRGSFSIPIALNDPIGKWRVSVKEVISGKEDTIIFEVK